MITPNAASVVLRAWIPRLLLIAATALFGLALSSGSAHADSLLDPVGHAAHQVSHVISRATAPALHGVASRSSRQHARSNTATPVRLAAQAVSRVRPVFVVTRVRHPLKRNLTAAQGTTAQVTKSLRAATANVFAATPAKTVVGKALDIAGSLSLPAVNVQPPALVREPILLTTSPPDPSRVVGGVPAIGGTQASFATSAELPATPIASDRRAARVVIATVNGLLDQLRAADSSSPQAMSALVMLVVGAAVAGSASMSPAASGGPAFALLPAALRLDTAGLVRRCMIPSRQSAFRTPSRPGFFPG